MRKRIVIALLLVSLLPLALTGAGAWVVFGRLLIDETVALQRSAVQSHAAAIELYLNERLRALELLARSKPLEDLTDPATLRLSLEWLNDTYASAFVDLGVIDEEGRHLAYEGPYDLRDKSYEGAEWLRIARQQGSFVSDVFLGFRQVPHCVVAVRSGEGGRRWYLRATINSDRFHALVRTLAVGATGDAFIVNAAGVYQTPPRFGRVLERAPIAEVSPHEGVRDRRLQLDHGPALEISTWINGGRWMLVVLRDEAEIRAPVDRAVVKGGLFVLLAVLVMVVSSLLAAWQLTAQIERATAQRDALSRDLMRSAKLASLGEMAAGFAHEINNPLAIISAVQTNLSDLLDDLALPPDARKDVLALVQRCRRQVDRCSNITAKILQFGRNADAKARVVEVGPLLREIVGLMQRQAQERNIVLQLEIDPGLKPLFLDSTELEQVLVNLINNAFAAIDRDGTVDVSARLDRDACAVVVADNGCGIAAEHLDQIFMPFFTTKPIGQGTGLGLAVCYGIVESWGGTIEVDSAPGQGTRMTVRIPVAAKGEGARKRVASSGTEVSNGVRG